MVSKIKAKELQIKRILEKGCSFSTVYLATWKGQEVAVKAQDKGSLQKTNPKDDRFIQELKILQLELRGTVKLLAYGDDLDGERFQVLEKLNKLPKLLSSIQVEKIIKTIIVTSRQLYLRGFNWTSSIRHIMFDDKGDPKLLDFNDDNIKENEFISRPKYYDVNVVCRAICEMANIGEEIISNTWDYLIKEEYQSLENVHQPIYFEKYKHTYRRETEQDDPNFMKLVLPNRQCIDRGKMIIKAIENLPKGSTCLDIGCNVGWFTFMLQEKGFEATGVDFDKSGDMRPHDWKNGTSGKIEFCRLIGELGHLQPKFDFADVTVDYLSKMPEYDVILALSILHLYFTQHHVSRDYWFKLFENICKKTKSILIFETSGNILNNIGVGSFNEFAELAKRVGKFKSTDVIGVSDVKRPLIVCTKNG